MTAHCEWCPFPGCDSCAYKGGENVTAQQDSGASTLYTGERKTAPAGNRGLDTTSRSKDSVMPYPESIHIPPSGRDKRRQQSYNAAYYAANRERIRAQQKVWRLANRAKIQASRKGITLEQFEDLIVRQGGCCAICSAPFAGTPHIDHDHTCCASSDACGECTRGLLCDYCNHMLGKARDRAEVLEAGAAYLRLFAGERGR